MCENSQNGVAMVYWNGGGFSPLPGGGPSMPHFKHWWGYAIFILIMLAAGVGFSYILVSCLGETSEPAPRTSTTAPATPGPTK